MAIGQEVRSPTPLLGGIRRLDQIRLRRFASCAVLVYALLALVAYLPSWPGDPSRLPLCACGDAVQQVWFLEWVPWAIGHGHSLFFTTRMDYPYGANLAINTEAPLLGFIGAPLTLLANPVATFNFFMWAAYPLSGAAMFAVVWRFTRSNVAAFTGGLLYGFSAYIVGEGLGHLNLTFVPLPPLIFLALYELVVVQGERRLRWAVALGLSATAQFLISPEVLSTTGIVALGAVVVLGVARRRYLTQARIAYALPAVGLALAVFVVICAYPLAYMLGGPQRYQGAVQGITNPYRADLLGPVVPTNNERYAPTPATALGNRFTGGGPAEDGSYLGIPLLLLAAWGLWRYRRNRWIAYCLGVAAVAYVLSLGPKLTVDAHLSAIPLPFDLIGRLPFLWNILPSRISLYQDLFVDLAVALMVADLIRTAPASAPDATPTRRTIRRFSFGALVLAAVISLIPRWPIFNIGTDSSVPQGFLTSVAPLIPQNGVVLTYPFTVSPADQPMLWQALDHLDFAMVGGYALVPKPPGSTGASPWPPSLKPIDVQEFLGYEELGPTGYLSSAPIPPNGRLVANFRRYVKRYGIDTVVFEPYGASSSVVNTVYDVLRRAFGPPRATVDDFQVWLHVLSVPAVRHTRVAANG